MTRERLELGVFMPIANNGWIISKNAPQYMPTWKMNKEIGQYAESIGFDYLFSMIKWRGFGGATEHWNHSLESLTLMSSLASVTERIGIIASMQPLVFNPVVAAKIAATIDEISGGRFGINLVTGQYFDEYAQMGVLPEGYASTRYDVAQEWTDALKALWTEERVDFNGKYFQLSDATSSPKPIQKPHPPIVCAGMSERGMAFTARNGARCFITGTDYESLKQTSRRAKEVAAGLDSTIKTDTVLVLILADTDEQANAMMESYREGVDVEAWKNIFNIYTQDADGASSQTVLERAKRDVFFAFLPVAGSAETVAEVLADIAVEGDLDGLLLTFPDYMDGLRRFHEDVRPALQRLGVPVGNLAVSA
jgi:pyrimidine oxygenase